MKKGLLYIATLLLSAQVFSQNILNAQSIEEFKEESQKKLLSMKFGEEEEGQTTDVLPYGYVDGKDILWSKVVWEIIDFNDKLNQPLYYSSGDSAAPYTSLYDALFFGVQNEIITEVYVDDNFTAKLTPGEISSKLESVQESDWLKEQKDAGKKVSNDDLEEGTYTFQIDTKKVKMLKVKGMWYIDKRLGEMKYRILGIAPMGPDPNMLSAGIVDGIDFTDGGGMMDLFWIFYPDTRMLLSKYNVFNPRNGASTITYDDLLNARRYSSIIYKTSTGLGGGAIASYIPGDAKAQLEESNRIKNEILEKENSMWNY